MANGAGKWRDWAIELLENRGTKAGTTLDNKQLMELIDKELTKLDQSVIDLAREGGAYRGRIRELEEQLRVATK